MKLCNAYGEETWESYEDRLRFYKVVQHVYIVSSDK